MIWPRARASALTCVMLSFHWPPFCFSCRDLRTSNRSSLSPLVFSLEFNLFVKYSFCNRPRTLSPQASSAMSVPSTSAPTTEKTQRPRGANWGTEEVKALIALWSEEDVQNALDDPLTRNTKIYKKIAQKLAELGYERTRESVGNATRRVRSLLVHAVFYNH